MLSDWQKFQKDARVARREAELAAERRRERIIEYVGAGVLALILIAMVAAFAAWVAWLKGWIRWP